MLRIALLYLIVTLALSGSAAALLLSNASFNINVMLTGTDSVSCVLTGASGAACVQR